MEEWEKHGSSNYRCRMVHSVVFAGSLDLISSLIPGNRVPLLQHLGLATSLDDCPFMREGRPEVKKICIN